jgi:predicted peptidase
MKFCLPMFLLLIGMGTAAGEPSASFAEPHLFKTQISRKISMQYLISLPSGYSESKQKWPLLFFFHGGSGRGDDIKLVSRYGPPAVAAKRLDYPFIVLSPQCPKGEIWTDTDLLIALIDDVLAHYRVDPDRIYLTGASMGGRGAWYLAYKHPDRFAAIVPICSWATNVDWAPALKDMPIWLFHGDKDTVVPISDSEDMVKALQAAGNNVKLTIMPGRGHDITDVYDRLDLYEWLLQHSRHH